MSSSGPASASAGLVKMAGYLGMASWVELEMRGALAREAYVAFFGVLPVIEAYAHDDAGAREWTEQLRLVSVC